MEPDSKNDARITATSTIDARGPTNRDQEVTTNISSVVNSTSTTNIITSNTATAIANMTSSHLTTGTGLNYEDSFTGDEDDEDEEEDDDEDEEEEDDDEEEEIDAEVSATHPSICQPTLEDDEGDNEVDDDEDDDDDDEDDDEDDEDDDDEDAVVGELNDSTHSIKDTSRQNTSPSSELRIHPLGQHQQQSTRAQRLEQRRKFASKHANQREQQHHDLDHQSPRHHQPVQQQQHQPPRNQQQQMSRQAQINILLGALNRIDPRRREVALVLKEITSSTLTTRLKGISRINLLIDHANEFNHSFSELGALDKYRECVDKFRDWLLRSKIIEHIFGPNCHVEIIKQSPKILNFVAPSLNDEHINIIWSASLMKHCGRQVLDSLFTLIRFMRTGPVLHLYSLVKSLPIEDHSEYTIVLTSQILKYIWSNSPCISREQFCNQHQQHPHPHHYHQPLQPPQPTQHHHQQQPYQPQYSQHNLQEHRQQQPQTTPKSGTTSASPLKETLAKGGDGQEPADDVKRSVVDHILKSLSDGSSQSSENATPPDEARTICEEISQFECNLDPKAREQQWLNQWKAAEFVDATSDVSACCSEEKDMGDFDDDQMHDFIQDENTISEVKSTIEEGSEQFLNTLNQHRHQLETIETSESKTLNSTSSKSLTHSNLEPRGDNLSINDSNSTSRDSESKFRFGADLANEGYRYQQHLPVESIAQFRELKKAYQNLSNITCQLSSDEELIKLSEYTLENISEPNKTLLWDLLQDGRMGRLSTNMHFEVENIFVTLVMSFGDRFIRYRFIEACLENLSLGKSVIMSLRLLPKLMSFNTITKNLSIPATSETHTIVLWAEREYNMSQNFFKNLVQYYKDREELLAAICEHKETVLTTATTSITVEHLKHLEEYGEPNCESAMFSHIDKIIARMSFLTFIYSKPFSPETMKLTREQMDQLWDCLASDTNPKCSDVLFQWIYQQAVGEDFHGVSDDLLDYVLKNKLPSLAPEHFRLRGLKLLEQLLWIRQDYECCHGLEHPATRLLWEIALKAVDDEVSMAAIRILNHFYIYTNHQKSTKCDKGVNFMNHCMSQLQSSLIDLTNATELSDLNQLLDVMQKVILLIRTHLEVFKAHWSYYLRILQLNNEADLISHRFSAYENFTVKLTMTVRLVCQAASSIDKITIEVQAGDFIGELRAEIVKWWYSQVDRSYFEQASLISPTSSSSSSSTSAGPEATSSTAADAASRQQSEDEKAKPSKFTPLSKRSPTDDANPMRSFTEFLLHNHNSLRLLSHNQEIPFEWDERQINELDFKDMQVIYVLNDVKPTTNLDQTDDQASDKSTESISPIHVPKTEIPSILLLRPEFFERLMEADRFLGFFQSKNIDLINRAKTLSRRVWEIIQILPTCPQYKEDLKRCGLPDGDWRLRTPQCAYLLSTECPQRLLYSLQIIDILKSLSETSNWSSTFIKNGGLADIYDVFMSQKLLPDNDEHWNEWLQECLAYLLKLLLQFGTKPVRLEFSGISSSSSSSSSRMSVGSCSSRANAGSSSSAKRIRRNRGRMLGFLDDRFPIPLFTDELLELLSDTDLIFSKLIRILNSSALCKSQSDQYYYVTMSSRAMIVHHVMSFLASWCKSDPKFPRFQIACYEQLLKALILDDTDPSTRREACNGFFKLHYACSTKSANSSLDPVNSSTVSASFEATSTSTITTTPSLMANPNVSTSPAPASSFASSEPWTFSSDLLKCLIKFLPIAEAMQPLKPIRMRNFVSENDYIKELNLPGCKDYFWLICRLIDSVTTDSSSSLDNQQRAALSPTASSSSTEDKSFESSSNLESANVSNSGEIREKCSRTISATSIKTSPINLFELCDYLVVAIRNRPTYETRDCSVEDDTLRGMLHMMVMAIRRDPSFRYTTAAYEFIHELYDYLFAPPNQEQRYLPKCKSSATRSAAYELMIALVERCPKNYCGLLELLLINQHDLVVDSTYPTDYWPHDDRRHPEVGFVGLINLGATCYLATCMQHLFMIPHLRYAILDIKDTFDIRHGEIIRELQKIFTFLLESERKAYNPRTFCKVYTMDNHPLNIAEQTDMTEFLTDLMTKLEESSPELRSIIKGLFSGTLSNNVVSLDCPHISRTTEEFYTLRVQVADMRNLNDSLDELTVKDTLEGDNMYTCSTCEKKVRAEKRACIVKLPRILCFNTMRYTFNMATMTKEKVNTHFSFPLKLDMADYLEQNLMKRQQPNEGSTATNSSSMSDSARTNTNTGSATGPNDTIRGNSSPIRDEKRTCNSSRDENSQEPSVRSQSKNSAVDEKSTPTGPGSSADTDDASSDLETMYELIGVTVHTGNADGGHYYCFIRDCEDQSTDKPRWYLFNDAEVKQFDDSHIGAECYGGELTTKSYDAINDRFMDFSIEKTNSAYMLFYKRVDYKYHSKSVALRYLESDTQHIENLQRDSINSEIERNDCRLHSDRMEVDSNDLNVETECTRPMNEKKQDFKLGVESFDGQDHVGSCVRSCSLADARSLPSPTADLNCRGTRFGDLDFSKLCEKTYDGYELPGALAKWIWADNMKFSRDKNVFEHNYFNFMWQLCANVSRTLNQTTSEQAISRSSDKQHLGDHGVTICPELEDAIAIKTVHLAIAFVLGVLMNSRERPNISNWTELIRKQFNSSKAACDWLMHLIDDDETWLKQMLLKCPIEMVRQLFQRLCNDLTGSKQHKKLRLIR